MAYGGGDAVLLLDQLPLHALQQPVAVGVSICKIHFMNAQFKGFIFVENNFVTKEL